MKKTRTTLRDDYDKNKNPHTKSYHVVEALIQGATLSTVYCQEQGAVRNVSPRGHIYIYTAPNKLSVKLIGSSSGHDNLEMT